MKDDAATAGGLDRRSLLLGGAAAGAATALGLADDARAEQPPAEGAGVVIGRIVRHRGADEVALDTEAGGTVVVQAAGAVVVDADGSRQRLADFAVGDGIAVDRGPGSTAAGTISARRVSPCVLGDRSDVER